MLHNLLRAGRPKKNLPLLFLLLGGALTAPGSLRFDLLVSSLLLLLVASVYMTHINVLADAELDREKKPYLMQWMMEDPRLMRLVLWIEFLVVVGGIAWLTVGHPYLGLGLTAFTALTVLYSYNFLVPWKAFAWRLKAHWAGHFIVALGAYLSLWVAGHFCSDSSTVGTFLTWMPIFFFVSLSEYSLFLSESAVDATEEKRFGLKTFATLLGRHQSSLLALGTWLMSSAGMGVYALAALPPGMSRLVFLAFMPAMLSRGVAALILAFPRENDRDDAIRLKLPDTVFWGSRLVTVCTLLALSF